MTGLPPPSPARLFLAPAFFAPPLHALCTKLARVMHKEFQVCTRALKGTLRTMALKGMAPNQSNQRHGTPWHSKAQNVYVWNQGIKRSPSVFLGPSRSLCVNSRSPLSFPVSSGLLCASQVTHGVLPRLLPVTPGIPVSRAYARAQVYEAMLTVLEERAVKERDVISPAEILTATSARLQVTPTSARLQITPIPRGDPCGHQRPAPGHAHATSTPG